MRMTVKLPGELMNQLSEFDKHTEEIIGKALTSGAKIAEEQAKRNLQSVIGVGVKDKKHKNTGQLVNALGVSPVKLSKDGWNVRVGFSEPRKNDYTALKASRQNSDPVRADAAYNYGRRKAKKAAGLGKQRAYSYYETTNSMVANVLEYGSKKRNQAAKPFMKPAADSTKSAAKAEIKRVFDEEANKYLKSKG